MKSLDLNHGNKEITSLFIHSLFQTGTWIIHRRGRKERREFLNLFIRL